MTGTVLSPLRRWQGRESSRVAAFRNPVSREGDPGNQQGNSRVGAAIEEISRIMKQPRRLFQRGLGLHAVMHRITFNPLAVHPEETGKAIGRPVK